MRTQRRVGFLDPDFGDNGEISFNVPRLYLTGSSLLRDGRLLSAAVAEDKRIILVRHLSDGSLDPAFGLGGVVEMPLGIPGSFTLKSQAVQADGKLVIAGQVYLPEGQYLYYLRFTPEGQLDGTFGIGGRAAINLPDVFDDEARSVAIRPDGKIVALARAIPNRDEWASLILRLQPDGTLDAAFGDGGYSYDTPSFSLQYSLQILDSGKLLIAGSENNADRSTLSRYDENGNADREFGENGHFRLQVPVQPARNEAFHAAHQDDGKIVIVGSTGETPVEGWIARVEANGSGLDADFNGGNPLLLSYGSRGSLQKFVTVLPEGKILSLGGMLGGGAATLHRFQADGTLDTDFGDGGTVIIGDTDGVSMYLSRVDIQDDGKYVVSGSSFEASRGWSVSIFRLLPA